MLDGHKKLGPCLGHEFCKPLLAATTGTHLNRHAAIRGIIRDALLAALCSTSKQINSLMLHTLCGWTACWPSLTGVMDVGRRSAVQKWIQNNMNDKLLVASMLAEAAMPARQTA